MSGLSDASMAADDVRRYSRMIGLSREESVYGTPGSSRSMSEPISSSCAGVGDRPEQGDGDRLDVRRRTSRSTATASASVSSRTTAPSDEMRSGISNVSRFGM